MTVHVRNLISINLTRYEQLSTFTFIIEIIKCSEYFHTIYTNVIVFNVKSA